MNAICVENLTHTYPGGRVALRGLSLEVAEGGTFGLLGPNGAGKSTLLLHLNGSLTGEGEITILGRPLTPRNLPEIRRLVGLLFEDSSDQLFMPTVAEDVAFGALNRGLSAAEVERRVREALRAVGVEDLRGVPPHHLSLGQRKRVALATVLVMDCQVLALDDPTGGLDPAGREELLELIGGLPLTKLIATHDMELAWEKCDRVGLMEGGRLVAQGPAQELLADEALLRAHGLRLPASARERQRLCPQRT